MIKDSPALRSILSALAIAAGCLAGDSRAQAPTILLEQVLQGLSSPVYVTNARDGSNRLFVVEQTGRIKVLAPGAGTPAVFLDVSSKIVVGGERGLLGLTFHPQFASNSRFFVNYTRLPDGATVIAEYHAGADPAATAASEIVLLTIAQPYSNHNGGMVEFGPDGYLYIGMGDGGSGNDPQNRAQNVNDLLGKILRIDVDHPAGGVPYSSPAGNPFAGPTPGRDEILAVGMRNPFRFSFDRSTGQLYVGDVGQGELEEIDIVVAGGNYGWRVYEGNTCTNLDPGLCTPGNYDPPIAQYAHTGGRCSIIGGYVYRGTRGTLASGKYVYGDYCTGEIFSLSGGAQRVELDTPLNISSFGEDESGELYVTGLNGTLNRIASAVPPQCTLTASPGTIGVGTSSTLAASCTPAATSYAWTNSGFGSLVASGSVSPVVTTPYSVVGSNAGGSGNSASATVTVKPALPSTPAAYADLVFTALTPCRLYDSRPGQGGSGTWLAGSTNTINVGPNASYAFQGGSATDCGLLAGMVTGEIAAIMASVSTVNQAAAGYLTIFPTGTANPFPYGVSQSYRSGSVQTSFVVMPTDVSPPVFASGFTSAQTNVIVDVVGYFAQPKAAALECLTPTAGITTAVAAGSTSAFIYSDSCAAGYTSAGGSCSSSSSNMYLMASGASSDNTKHYCQYRNTDAASQIVTATNKCCRTAGR